MMKQVHFLLLIFVVVKASTVENFENGQHRQQLEMERRSAISGGVIPFEDELNYGMRHSNGLQGSYLNNREHPRFPHRTQNNNYGYNGHGSYYQDHLRNNGEVTNPLRSAWEWFNDLLSGYFSGNPRANSYNNYYSYNREEPYRGNHFGHLLSKHY